jgi:hypothetical protein
MTGSGIERGGLLNGTENMKPRLSLSISLSSRQECGNSPTPADQ